ncbi:hypothetical protein JXL21_05085 [Candidatus Bathyarchaeota archaeon]|nr:hypothetical protein [Candidatus Bathyarchaeota archaeon]
MEEKERAELENRLLKLEKTVQELLLAHLQDRLGEATLSLVDLGLVDVEAETSTNQPGLV